VKICVSPLPSAIERGSWIQGVLKQNHVRELNVSLMKSVAFTGGVQDLTANLENAA